MTDSDPEFAVGDRVVLLSTDECGIVVHTWAEPSIGGIQDCYVVFFGKAFPEAGEPPEKLPYVLRYAATSLQRA